MNRSKLLLITFSFIVMIFLASCSGQNQVVTVSGGLITQSGEPSPAEFSVMLCPIRTKIFLQQVIECGGPSSPAAVTADGKFIIEEVPVGQYGMKLNPPESGFITLVMLENSAGEDFIFQAKSGQDLDLGQIEVPEAYYQD